MHVWASGRRLRGQDLQTEDERPGARSKGTGRCVEPPWGLLTYENRAGEHGADADAVERKGFEERYMK